MVVLIGRRAYVVLVIEEYVIHSSVMEQPRVVELIVKECPTSKMIINNT